MGIQLLKILASKTYCYQVVEEDVELESKIEILEANLQKLADQAWEGPSKGKQVETRERDNRR